jgi:predicted XRE-type DNA-binding protein
MGLHQTKNLLHSKGNSHQTEEAIHRIRENFCQLSICQWINNQNLQGTQITELPKIPQPNEEIGKLTEQTFFKGRSINGQ